MWAVVAGAAALAGAAAVAILLLQPRAVWIRWDGSVATAESWATEHVQVTGGPGGPMTIRASGGIRLSGAVPFAAQPRRVVAAPSALQAVAAPTLQTVVAIDDATIRVGSPDGPVVPAASLGGIGLDAREVFLVEQPWWRGLVDLVARSTTRRPQTVRYVETARRVIDGVEWREFRAAGDGWVGSPGPTLVQVLPSK